jgi:hypothetical protein
MPAELDALLGQPLVLQRAGTVVVLDDGWLDDTTTLDAAHSARRWTLHVCLAADGTATGVGYEDAGDGDGPVRRDTYLATRANGEVVVEWRADGAFPRNGPNGVVVHGVQAGAATADGRPVEVIATRDATSVALDHPFSRLSLVTA